MYYCKNQIKCIHLVYCLYTIIIMQDSDHELLVSNFIDLKAHVTSYSITYLDMATGNICSEDADIPAGSCHGGVCRHVFDVSSSFCHPSTNITITVRTLTLLGAGPPSDPITIGNSFGNSPLASSMHRPSTA